MMRSSSSRLMVYQVYGVAVAITLFGVLCDGDAVLWVLASTGCGISKAEYLYFYASLLEQCI